MNNGMLTSGYAPPQMPGGLLGGSSPVPAPEQAWHAEAADWRRRVIANGGTVSHATMSAVDQFCRRIDAAGLRDRFYRLSLICGDQLAAALVPLYRSRQPFGAVLGNATDTNNNFVAADYVERGAASGGLKPNGTTKYLNTGFNASTTAGVSSASFHLGVYVSGTEAAGSSRVTIGCDDTSSFVKGPFVGWLTGGSQDAAAIASNVRAVAALPAKAGFILGNVSEGSERVLQVGSGRAISYFENGFRSGPQVEATNTFSNQSIFVCAGNNNGPVLYSLARFFRGYTIGAGLSFDQVRVLLDATQTFNSALGRRV